MSNTKATAPKFSRRAFMVYCFAPTADQPEILKRAAERVRLGGRKQIKTQDVQEAIRSLNEAPVPQTQSWIASHIAKI